MFLNEIEHLPQKAIDQVFQSDLYENMNTNHRCHANFEIYKKLFDPSEFDPASLYPLLVYGAAKMREKLCTYAQSQLPGGIYWEPELSVKEVLSELKPSNDLCLGLNDYLTSAIPNLHQMARFNL